MQNIHRQADTCMFGNEGEKENLKTMHAVIGDGGKESPWEKLHAVGRYAGMKLERTKVLELL